MKKINYFPLIILLGFIIYSLGFNFFESLPPFRNVTIQEVQQKSNDSLMFGKDKSNILGDSVTVVGRVIAPPKVSPANNDFRTLLRGANSYQCYIQDTANGLFGGLVLRQATRFTNTAIDVIDTGAIIKVKGYVQEFGGTNFPNSGSGFLTQLQLDTLSSPVQIQILQPSGSRPTPKSVNITDFANGDYPNGGTINYLGGEKYEGMYVEIRNVTVSTGIGNRQPWSIVDDNGNKLYFRDFSNFYSTQPSGDTLRPWTHPSVGTTVNYIRGVIINANNEGAFGTQIPYAIVPIYPNDLSLGNPPPVLSNITRTPGVPTPSDNVTVTVTITDPGLNPVTIDSARVFYRTNGGPFNSVNLTPTGSIYSGTIPPAPLGTLVEYFFRSKDNSGNVKTLPSDTLRSKLFYKVQASDSLTIQDVQYCPNNGGRSAYEAIDVRGIEGIVTADTSDIRNFSFTSPGGTQTSPRRIIIQNGTGAFSGIWISGTPTDVLRRGDRVRIKGTVEENFSVTRINVTTPSNIVLLSQNNPLPSPQILTTSDLANNKPDGDTTIEKWESVFVRLQIPCTISCVNAAQGTACITLDPLPDTSFRRNFGEVLVRDASNIESRIELQDGNHSFTNNWDGLGTQGGTRTLLTKNDIITTGTNGAVQGILFFSFSNWKLVPRKNDDWGTVIPVGIVNTSTAINSFNLSQNYPNPFNPVTKINFSLPVKGLAVMKIYDMLGREINTLVNSNLNAGSYSVDFNGSNFTSGTYFYRLYVKGNDGKSFIDTKRMVLVK